MLKVMDYMHKVFIRSLALYCFGLIALGASGADDRKITPKFDLLLSRVNPLDEKSCAVDIALKNISAGNIYFLNWTLPEKGELQTNMFVVKDAHGKRMEYLGIYAQRLAPQEHDFVLIKKGETYECSVELNKYYNCDEERFVSIDAFIFYYPEGEFDLSKSANFEKLTGNTLRLDGKKNSWFQSIVRHFMWN